MKKSTYEAACYRLRKSTKWTTGAGDTVAVSDMETSHLQNTIIYLSKKQEECDKYKLGDYQINDITAEAWIDIFKSELKSRN